MDGDETVKLWRERIKVRASIHTVGGLSAHADQDGMLTWYGNFKNRPPVLLVHGEKSSMKVLAKKLRKDFGAKAAAAKRGKTTNLLKLERFA